MQSGANDALGFLVPLAMVVEATQGRRARGNARCRGHRFSFPPIFRPCVLSITTLAMAIAIWGTGYKLSRYLHAPEQAHRIPVARLWVEHRHAATPVVATLQSKTPAVLVAVPLVSHRQPMLRMACIVVPSLGAQGAATPGALLPFRSPPSLSFLLS